MTFFESNVTCLVTNMLSVSRSTDYAVRVVLHLATLEEGARESISGISRTRDLPVPFVRRIVSRLAEVGILRTVRGAGGGVALAREASRITLHDVVSAMEGPTCASPCLEEPGSCKLSGSCPVRGVWSSTGRILDNHLRSVHFADLARGHEHRRAHRNSR